MRPEPWDNPRLNAIPGTGLIGPDDWLFQCDAFAAQMAERDRLVAEHPGEVLASVEGAEDALYELLRAVVDRLRRETSYKVFDDHLRRPDGVRVDLDGPVLPVLARLVQEDLCLLDKRDGAYVLIAASLCFPAHWLLSEKIGQSMGRIHAPVERYDDNAEKRVTRLMDGLKPGLPIFRENGMQTHSAELFTPESEASHHAPGQAPREDGRFWRSERQCLLRLPETGALVFSIHTRVWPIEGVAL